MRFFYRLLYAVGVKPWEHLSETSAGEQVSAMLDEVEQHRGSRLGSALDLGCGTGIWSVRLARRGWDVTGVDVVQKAVDHARQRAAEAGVRARFAQGNVADLQGAGIGSGFDLVLDLGTVHGLKSHEVRDVAREVTAATSEDATLLMYASAPGRRGPLPRGLAREELEEAYDAWTVVDERPLDLSGVPTAFGKTEPRWFQLRRTGSTKTREKA